MSKRHRQLTRANWTGEPEILDSADRVRQAASGGSLEIETTEVIVNYPFVKWPGGELQVDPGLEKPSTADPWSLPPTWTR